MDSFVKNAMKVVDVKDIIFLGMEFPAVLFAEMALLWGMTSVMIKMMILMMAVRTNAKYKSILIVKVSQVIAFSLEIYLVRFYQLKGTTAIV